MTSLAQYSAAQMADLLGLPAESSEAIPDVRSPLAGELLVWYGGWPLAALCTSPAGQKHMHRANRYNAQAWRADPGYYRVLLRVPDSNDSAWSEQKARLSAFDEGQWQPAPVAVAAAALLAHLAATGQDALQGDWSRCDVTTPDGFLTTLGVPDGRVLVTGLLSWQPGLLFYMAASRKC